MAAMHLDISYIIEYIHGIYLFTLAGATLQHVRDLQVGRKDMNNSSMKKARDFSYKRHVLGPKQANLTLLFILYLGHILSDTLHPPLFSLPPPSFPPEKERCLKDKRTAIENIKCQENSSLILSDKTFCGWHPW